MKKIILVTASMIYEIIVLRSICDFNVQYLSYLALINCFLIGLVKLVFFFFFFLQNYCTFDKSYDII